MGGAVSFVLGRDRRGMETAIGKPAARWGGVQDGSSVVGEVAAFSLVQHQHPLCRPVEGSVPRACTPIIT